MRLSVIMVSTVLFISVATAGAWLLTAPIRPFPNGDLRLIGQGDVARGRLVFASAECSSCHASPGQENWLSLGGGLALASPFGTFRPSNISPDPVDGIGNWTVTDLANALIGGVSPQGTHYYPAFPYTSFTGMTLSDVKDLYAYLMTLPNVSGRAPSHHPSILFTIRRSVGFWKLLFFRPGDGSTSNVSDSILERGRYLVETMSHCAECHSSRNVFGAIEPDTKFAGGIDPQGTGYVPNITPTGLGSWTQGDLVRMLKTGETPNHGRVGSSMADVVSHTATLPEGDIEAIATYIRSLPPRETPKP
jgi:mono/diheme cytochrome c family protein